MSPSTMSIAGNKPTGKALIAHMQRFIWFYVASWPSLKLTTQQGTRASVHLIRCALLEQFLEEIDKESIIAHIQNEYNIIALFLHEVLDPGTPAVFNSRTESGIEGA